MNVQGAVDVANKSVRYDIEQNLTEAQKLRARINIGAVSEKELDNAISAIKIGETQIADEAVTESKLSASLVAKINSPKIIVDTEMSDESTNVVQNKVIKAYVDKQKSDLTAQIQLVSGNLDAVKQDVHDEQEKTNAAITGLQSEVTTIKENVSTNTDGVSSLKARVTTLEDTVKNIKPDESLVARISTLETTSTEHTEQITGLSGRVAALEETSGGSSVDLTEVKKTLSTHTTEIEELKQCVAWSEQ